MKVRWVPKPKHLSPMYGDQFKDSSVAKAYAKRPLYSPELVSMLEGLIQDEPRFVLDIGCGTGEIAIPLARRTDNVDAVDPSEAMLKIARSRPGGDQPNIRWVLQSAEEFEYPSTYSLILAAGSLHWLDWYTVIPRMKDSLSRHGYLATVHSREPDKAPWQPRLNELIPRYSTNKDFEPYDLIEELEIRRLFNVAGRRSSRPWSFSQSVDEYVESFHSRNGFSRERMDAASASEFDSGVRAALEPYASNGNVQFSLTTEIVWGRPLS